MFILSLSDSEAAGIYYIPWPAKKNCCLKFLHKFVCQKQPKLCSLHSQLAKAAKKMNFKQTYCTSSLLSYSASAIYCKSMSVSCQEKQRYLVLMVKTALSLRKHRYLSTISQNIRQYCIHLQRERSPLIYD